MFVKAGIAVLQFTTSVPSIIARLQTANCRVLLATRKTSLQSMERSFGVRDQNRKDKMAMQTADTLKTVRPIYSEMDERQWCNGLWAS